MAKRFTDTEKWKRPWYRKLPPALRELWNYMLDSCDHAGVWMEDLELAELILGFPLDRIAYDAEIGPKLIRIDEDKVLIPSFIEFQYGDLDPGCKTHQSVIKQLERYGVDLRVLQKKPFLPKGIKESPKGLGESQTLKDKDKDKDKEKDQEKEKDKKGECEGEPPESLALLEEPDPPEKAPRPQFNFEVIYQDYPLKKGKNEGLAACKAQIKTQAQYDQLHGAVRRYRAECEREGKEPKFIQHFSTFMHKNRWKDWLDPETGTAVETDSMSHIDWSKFT